MREMMFHSHLDLQTSFKMINKNMAEIKFNDKKAQITIFLIFAILIVLGLIVFILLRFNGIEELESAILDLRTENLIKDKYELNENYRAIYDLIDICILDLGYEAVEKIGENGGYLRQHDNVINYPEANFSFTYYFDRGKVVMPKKSEIENEISDYINKNLKLCTVGILFFNYDIKEGDVKTKTEITREDVEIYVEYPVFINDNDFSFTLKDFSVAIPIRLGTIYDSISDFINKQNEYGAYECKNCFNKLNNLTVSRILSDRNNINDPDVWIYFVKDKESELKGIDHTFIFANIYEKNNTGNNR